MIKKLILKEEKKKPEFGSFKVYEELLYDKEASINTAKNRMIEDRNYLSGIIKTAIKQKTMSANQIRFREKVIDTFDHIIANQDNHLDIVNFECTIVYLLMDHQRIVDAELDETDQIKLQVDCSVGSKLIQRAIDLIISHASVAPDIGTFTKDFMINIYREE